MRERRCQKLTRMGARDLGVDVQCQFCTKKKMKTFSRQSTLSNMLCRVVIGLLKDPLGHQMSCVIDHHVKSWGRPVREWGRPNKQPTFCQYSRQSHVTTKHTYSECGKTLVVIDLQTAS